MTARVRYRDVLRRLVPSWLSDRAGEFLGKTVGFRFLWAMVAPLDVLVETAEQALQAPWPGYGTPTAFGLTGRGRGIIRGQGETDDAYALRLRVWLATWRGDPPVGGGAGSQLALAMAFHKYLANNPRVRVVNRSGKWTTVNADGTVTLSQATFNWDSVSHPERAGNWWDQWVIVYPTQWAHTVAGVRTLGDRIGVGHTCPPEEYDALLGEIEQWKSAHTYLRAVIWTSDATLFDPAVPASCPNGTWGAWGGVGSGSRTLGGRNLTTCRYWETSTQ